LEQPPDDLRPSGNGAIWTCLARFFTLGIIPVNPTSGCVYPAAEHYINME
jgi:hypothetical protein